MIAVLRQAQGPPSPRIRLRSHPFALRFQNMLNHVADGTFPSRSFADELADFLENIGGYFGSDTLNDMGEALHGDSIVDYLLHFAGTETAEYLFRGNILGKSNATKEQFDKFKRANRIVGNFSWNQAKILEGGSDVFLIVDYEIEVIRLFFFFFFFSMRHCSYATAWFGS